MGVTTLNLTGPGTYYCIWIKLYNCRQKVIWTLERCLVPNIPTPSV
jgi:hypothetical protein